MQQDQANGPFGRLEDTLRPTTPGIPLMYGILFLCACQRWTCERGVVKLLSQEGTFTWTWHINRVMLDVRVSTLQQESIVGLPECVSRYV
jgi:hypothetical protein